MKHTRRAVRFIGAILGGAFMLILAACLFVAFFLPSENERANRDPARRQEMMTVTLEWGRLAPFPSTARDLSVRTTGNLFTRGFESSFVAPPADIARWIDASPGLRETEPDLSSAGVRRYRVKPGGGAQFAEIRIDDTTNTVHIRVYWS